MGKATEEDLGNLHGVIARGLTEVIENGQVIGVEEDGKPIKVTAPASYFAAGLKMLADNSVTADPRTNEAIQNLTGALAQRGKAREGKLSKEALEQAALVLERDLGGPMQ